MGLWEKLFGTKHDREIKKLGPLVSRIGEFAPTLQKLDDAALKAKTAEFRRRIDKGESLDDLLPEAFAVVREASGRALGMRHYDVQLIGGITLHKGRIAEMKTGEGKTLVATLPLYLNALSGKGCHLITVNDYLADRDAEWMGRVYNFLGLSVGCILRTLTNEQRRAAYNSDITYGTNSEMGFDYLRDNMKLRLEDYVQRGHNFAIVDEVDSILIDEARTPLIISGPAEGSVDRYTEVDASIPQLRPELDFQVDLKAKSAFLTDEGTDKIQKLLGIDNLYDPKNLESLHALNQALRAHAVYRKDVEYVVREGKVIIVDEFTGRLMPGRRWSDGLHQAIEAKEKVEIEPENRTVATITYQNFFLLYQKLAGMTGTADTEAEEFKKIYNLEVTVIPTNRPVQRKDESDLVYKTEGEKFEAVAEEISAANKRGQPVLVGTVSVEKSEIVSRMLKRKGITHEVLNAKNHGREALIVAQAGRLGAVTIATNMAGRGTDILLGGNPEYLARERAGVDAPEEVFKAELAKAKGECDEAKKKILVSGGLHIVGTERHDSRRVDNQLRGRAGRQGDPGSSRFYLSLEDSMMKAFGADRISNMMDRLGYEKGVPIEHPWLTSAIEDAQKRLEGYHFGIRKNLKEYDDVLAQQRSIFYGIRRQVLEGAGTKELVLEAIENAVFESVDATCSDRKPPKEWNLTDLKEIFKKIFEEDVPLDLSRLESEKQPTDIFRDRISTHLKDVYEQREEEVTSELMRRLEREVLLKAMDHLWMDHLAAMDHLRDSVRLRGIGQRNPLLEYKKEGYHLFQSMYALRDEEVLTRLFRYRRANEAQIQALEEQRRAEALRQLQGFGGRPHVPGEAPGAPFRRPPPQTRLEPPAGQVPGQPGVQAQPQMEIQLPPGFPPQLAAMLQNLPPAEAGKFLQRLVWHQNQMRNNPCWCGSGKKYKKCHMEQDLVELGPPPETPPGEGTILIPNQAAPSPRTSGPAQPELSGVVEPERDEAQAAARAAAVSDAEDKVAPVPPAPVPDVTSPDLSDEDDDNGLLMMGAVKRKKK